MQTLAELVCRVMTGHAHHIPDKHNGTPCRRCLDCMAVLPIAQELRTASGPYRQMEVDEAFRSRFKVRPL